MFDIRDRFEDLLEAHPAVTIVDGDREWTTARIDAPDPEALVAELWARRRRCPPGAPDGRDAAASVMWRATSVCDTSRFRRLQVHGGSHGDRWVAASTVQRAAAGNEAAFAALVAEHHAAMVRVACVILGDREAAQDAVQWAWAHAWRRVQLHPQRHEGPGLARRHRGKPEPATPCRGASVGGARCR